MTIATIDNYIEQAPIEYQQLLKQMRQIIQEEAPEATEKISYQMPTFYLKGNLVHFALNRNHLGFYPSPSAIVEFASQLTPYVSSKGAIQFPYNQPLPVSLIKAIVRFRVNENKKK